MIENIIIPLAIGASAIFTNPYRSKEGGAYKSEEPKKFWGYVVGFIVLVSIIKNLIFNMLA